MTPLERQVLQRLNDLGHRTAAPFGVNPISFGGERAAACARRMAAKGWTRLDRIGERHIRYGITGAGRLALAERSKVAACQREAVLANVRPEIAGEVAYAFVLASLAEPSEAATTVQPIRDEQGLNTNGGGDGE